MRSTRVRLIASSALILALTTVTTAQSEPRVPEGWHFELPSGDAAAGKTTFMKMRCFACHATLEQGDTAAADMGDTGPALGSGYAKLPAEYLAESIIKAHTVVAAPNYRARDDAAGMGNYNYFLTVQELVDLVTYLKSLALSE